MIKLNLNHRKGIYVVSIISILLATSGLRAEERQPVSKTLSETTKEFLSDRARTGSLLGSIIVGAAVPNPLSPLLGSLAGFIIGKRSAYTSKDSNAAQRQAYNNRSLIPLDDSQVTSLAGLTGDQPQASEQTVLLGLSEEIGAGYQAEQNEQIVIVGSAPIVSAIRSLSGETGTGYLSQPTEKIVTVGNTPIVSPIKSLPMETGTSYQSQQTEEIVIVRNTPIVSPIKPLPMETGTGYQSQQSEEMVIVRNTSIGSAVRSLSGETRTRSNLQQQLAYACSNVQHTKSMSLGCYYHSQ